MRTFIITTLATAVVNAAPQHVEGRDTDRIVCWTGIYGECAPSLANYAVAQGYCSAKYPVACTTEAQGPKIKRRDYKPKACKQKASRTKVHTSGAFEAQESAWSKVLAQQPDVVETLCGCIATPRVCPSYGQPGKPKPQPSLSPYGSSCPNPGPFGSSRIASASAHPTASHGSPIYAASSGHNAAFSSHGPSSSASASSGLWSSASASSYPSPSSMSSFAAISRGPPASYGGSFTSSLSTVRQSSSGSRSLSSSSVIFSVSPNASSSTISIVASISSVASSASSITSSAASISSVSSSTSSTVSLFSSSSQSSSESLSSSAPSSSPIASSTESSLNSSSAISSVLGSSSSSITSIASCIASTTTSSAFTSSSSVVPVVPLPCNFPNQTEFSCANGQSFGSICGQRIVQAIAPDAAFLFTTNPPEYTDCINDCANNDYCYVWSFTRDAGGNTCFPYQNVNGNGAYETGYDPYSVRGYYNSGC